VAVLVIDLDGFKAVNDQLGHAAGDDVIRVVGSRIAQEIRRGDIAARIGGDEFAILCRGVVDVAEAEGLAERLLASVPDVIDIGGTRVEIGLSIGIAVAADGQRPEPLGLIELADRMLYEAKRRGKGRYRVARLPPRTSSSPECQAR
jgi:diguanylate cyclase (GGDEF)-like protein